MKNTIAAHRVVLLAILFVGTALFPMQAQAWGERGHRYQAQLLMGILPPDIREFFAAAEDRPLRDTVMYPDSFEPFETELLGRRALEVLEQHAIAHRYALHSHPRGGRGPAVSFMLLTQAFDDDEPQRAAIWAGSLLHALGDDFAANHGPLIHYLTYGFRGQSVGIGEGVGLDFGDLDRPGRRELVATLLEGYEPSIVAEEPGVVLQKIVGMGYRNAAFMTHREQAIAATFAEGASEQTIERGKQALAELGVQAVQQVADLIVTAWHFAQQGRTPQLDDAIIAAAEQETQQFLREKPLEMDSIYTGLLDPPERSPAVGIVLEPTRNFNEGVFRGGTKYILAAIMHELQRADVAYLPVDVRHLDRQDLPSPDDVPVMIVCAGSFALGGQAREAFQTYANAGGRYLWVGGASNRYGDILGPLSRSLEVAEEHLRPVTRAYGEPHLEVIESLSVHFLNRYAEALGEQDYPFLKNPNTPAGWQKPICDLHVVSDDPAIKGLAAVSDGEQTVTVAAAWMEGEDRQARHVFLPEYLLAPYLLSGEQLVRNPAEPALDRVGQAVLLASLELLHGRPAPDEQAKTERRYVTTAQGERPEPIVAIDNVCAWPNLTVLRDGTIIATIFNQPSHGLVAGDVDCWASEDGGATWTKRGTPAPRDNEDSNRMNVAAGLANNGDLLVISSGWTSRDAAGQTGRPFRERTLSPWICRSADGGRTWSVDKDGFPELPSGGGIAIPFGDIVAGEDGCLRVFVYRGDSQRAYVSRSCDDGKTWGEPTPLDDGSMNNETAPLHLGDGKWLAAARSDGLNLYYSDDDAKTWTHRKRVTDAQQHPGDLHRLQDGRILLTYGNRTSPGGVDVRFSDDLGHSWSDPIRVVDCEGDRGYPSSVQLPDGRVLTAYYAQHIAGHDRYHMGVVVWDPSASLSRER